jgi:hypothetical protein
VKLESDGVSSGLANVSTYSFILISLNRAFG